MNMTQVLYIQTLFVIQNWLRSASAIDLKDALLNVDVETDTLCALQLVSFSFSLRLPLTLIIAGSNSTPIVKENII